MFLAIVLITVGLAFLGLNVGLIPASTFHVLWPLLLLFFGVYMMMKGPKSLNDSVLTKKKKRK